MSKFQVIVDADLEPIMPRYMEIQNTELHQLDKAVAAGDGEAVRRLGHKMKGSGSSYGFPEITEAGLAIENAGKTDDMAAAQKLVDWVRTYFADVEVIYKEMD